MSRLVRLYPAAWRERYEDEFLALLAERPPTFADLLDTVRGAVDAHLNPQVQGEPSPWTHRIPGTIALIAGAMWTAAFLAFVLWPDGAWAVFALIPVSLILMLLSLPGDYMAAYGRRIAAALGVIGLCIVVANLPYSPLALIVGVGGYPIALGGMLTMAAIRAGIGTSGRWAILVLAVVLPVAIGLPTALGLGAISADESFVFALFLPYGLAWLLVGLRMAVRGAATLLDLPASTIEPEVHAS